MAGILVSTDLPGFWRAADAASLTGQRRTLLLTRIRILGLILAAGCGALMTLPSRPTVAATGAVVAFVMVLICEIISWVLQPERDWYSGRALAESAKTLAWRFGVAGAPFSADLDEGAAEELMGARLEEVSREARDRVTIEPGEAVTTVAMKKLRDSPFSQRKEAYIVGRIEDQHHWYATKAVACRNRATKWRVALIAGQTIAIALGILQISHPFPVSVAGLASTLIGCASAWIAVKQYSSLAAAYSITATELALLKPKVQAASEDAWSGVVDDAEEAISREHTLWLASRTGKATVRPRPSA